MSLRNKIGSETEAGESPTERLPAFRAPALRPYLPDPRILRTACHACAQGSARILALTWQWCRTAPHGDRLLRATAPAGALALAVYAVRVEGRAAVAGLAAGWLVAAAILAPRQVWAVKVDAKVVERQRENITSEVDFLARDRAAMLALLEEVTRGRNGIHLSELEKHIVTHPYFSGVSRPLLGALLDGLGIPVARTLSVDGIEGRTGVRRSVVEQLLNDASPALAGGGSQPSESGSDQQVSRSLSDGSRAALGMVSEG